MKAIYKTQLIHFAVLSNGKEIPIKGNVDNLIDGQEIKGDIETYDVNPQYENGEHSRDIITYEDFILDVQEKNEEIKTLEDFHTNKSWQLYKFSKSTEALIILYLESININPNTCTLKELAKNYNSFLVRKIRKFGERAISEITECFDAHNLKYL